MGKILKMSPQLANMIAAGEVVERPSSVVKELIENAIDANSKNIKIYLKNGGLEEIKIIDDGDGMDADDVCMAFQPHATSKIKNEYDLFRINTLGFRGEAIASIASVSTMQIISSQNGVEGYQCTYSAGILKSNGIINSNKGTTVIVSGLFFNTPARLKYMKTAKNELASIMFFIDRIAMAHTNLRFSVYHDNKLIFQTTGSSDYKTLIGEIYGLDAAKNVMLHSYVSDGYSAKLVFVKPSIYRSNKLEITMIVNGRYVKNYNVTNAVIEGFATYLPIGKYPIGIIYMDIDPMLVDVNVHPSKVEIKIANEELLCDLLKNEIRKMITSDIHIPERSVEATKPISYNKTSIFDNLEAFDVNESFEPSYNKAKENIAYNDEKLIDNKIAFKPENDIKEEYKEAVIKPRKLPYMEYVGTVFGTYLIFQNSDGMHLIDQHAAAERINYEKIYKQLSLTNHVKKPLLIPIMLTFTKQEALYLEENLEQLSNIGFELSQVGNLDYALRVVPAWAHVDEIENIVYEILSIMISNRKIDVMYFRDYIAKQISCKSSIKANHYISKIEIDSLLSQLEECENPFTCPHGRPTIIKLTINEIEKMFERIQK